VVSWYNLGYNIDNQESMAGRWAFLYTVNEAFAWENHRTRWGICQQAMELITGGFGKIDVLS
jgi:hypothetical protein